MDTRRQLMSKAEVYGEALYPPMVAGLINYTMMTYIDQSEPEQAETLAREVVRDAEARGWSTEPDSRGFLQALSPLGPGTVTVFRSSPGAAWELVGSLTTFRASANLERVLAEAARQATAHPGLKITYRDNGALNTRT